MKIRLENVSKSLSFKEHFNARAEVLHLLEGISCELDDGENLAILGQSGSGKSTLAKLISFSEPKSGGKIYINSEEITDKMCIRDRYIFSGVSSLCTMRSLYIRQVAASPRVRNRS